MINALPFEPRLIKQAIIFIGIQASGKSTFYKDMLAQHQALAVIQLYIKCIVCGGILPAAVITAGVS